MERQRIRNHVVTTVIGMCLCAGAVLILRIREKKINREIDEFDRIMHELKASERKEVTKCCQIK